MIAISWILSYDKHIDMPEKFGKDILVPPKEERFAPDDEGLECVQVSMNMLEEIPSGDEIFIEGLAPCIGVVIYQPKTKEACAGHFSDIKAIERLMGRARGKFGDMSELKVFMGGVSPLGREQTVKQDRLLALQIVQEAGIPSEHIHAEFNERSSGSVNMVFKTKTGEIEYEYEEE